jgi:hypothetical protein
MKICEEVDIVKNLLGSVKIGSLLVLMFASALLLGCSSSTYQTDLTNMVCNNRLPRQKVKDLAYQVRKFIKNQEKSNFSKDMGSYNDRLGYWSNAEMVDICGVINLKGDKEDLSKLSEIVSAKVIIFYEGFVISTKTNTPQFIYAEADFKNDRWQVKSAEEKTGEIVKSQQEIAGHMTSWLNQSCKEE